jgi:hypothetical protein
MALRTLLRTPANGEALAAALERAATRARPTDLASVADAVDALAALLAAGVEGPAGTAVPHLQLMLATALERAMRSAEAAHHLRGGPPLLHELQVLSGVTLHGSRHKPVMAWAQ